jgi:type IX secretion system PorP/SprF family membrane protein
MNKIFFPILSLLLTFGSYAQELTIPIQTQYLADNPFMLSATYAGIGDNFRIRLNGLTQWVGIKDSPINQSLSMDFRIADRSGVGAVLYNDKNGNTRQYGAKLAFAQHLILDYDTEQYLSLGLSFNLNNFRIDTEKFDPNIFDIFVTDDRFTQNYNLDVGFLYRNRGFFAAFNTANILNKDIDKYFNAEPSLLRNYQMYTGFTYRPPSTEDFEIEPSAFFQYFESDKRSSTDINAKFRFYNMEDYYWGGITYRFLNDQVLKPLTIGPMIGLKKNRFYAGYSYEVTLNNLIGYNSGTHMLTVGFDFLQNASNCPCTQPRIVY